MDQKREQPSVIFELNELKWAREILTKEFRETKPKSLGNELEGIINKDLG